VRTGSRARAKRRSSGRKRTPTLKEVARRVARALGTEGIRAVLTGGACASFYSGGACRSSDLDFVLLETVDARCLDRALASIGFVRRGNHFGHPGLPFIVEFPRGPLAIGRDVHIEPAGYRIRGAVVPALSATDSCRDRLAAFYHWADRSSLRAAVAIARRHPVDQHRIRAWSESEGARRGYGEFLALLGPKRSA
jgi:hypothetical protein